MKTSAFDLPKKTITIRWEKGKMDLLLHLAMPKMTKDGVTKSFALLRKFYWYGENQQLVQEIREWFYVATDRSLDTWRQAQKACNDGFRDATGKTKAERSKIIRRNKELQREVATARRVNDRLEDRLQLFETMFKGL